MYSIFANYVHRNHPFPNFECLERKCSLLVASQISKCNPRRLCALWVWATDVYKQQSTILFTLTHLALAHWSVSDWIAPWIESERLVRPDSPGTFCWDSFQQRQSLVHTYKCEMKGLVRSPFYLTNNSYTITVHTFRKGIQAWPSAHCAADYTSPLKWLSFSYLFVSFVWKLVISTDIQL